ncbi:MAG: type II toxin-antitoxin system PemK/MazF family toxin [Actinomycetia bacterium]|nr:type II toxin-antitoxin system PemK/MazF family toxin [Actinomycetes bacterium]
MKYQWGDVVTIAGGTYTSKPRPVVFFQDPKFDTGDSAIVIPLTSYPVEGNELRIPVEPTTTNGLDRSCYLEVDKLSAVRAGWLGAKIGHLDKAVTDAAREAAHKLLAV